MALTICADDLADILDPEGEAIDHAAVEAAGRALAFAEAQMVRYLGSAAALEAVPDAIVNNAALRIAGWLADAPSVQSKIVTNTRQAGTERAQRAAEFAFSYSVDHRSATASPLRSSGGMALLSPYKVRRAI